MTVGLESSADGVVGPHLEIRGGARLYGRPLLWMLSLAYACNFMDRSVVSTLAQAIKVDLLLSDAQLGLLQGYAYVVLYSVAGLPLAWLAERRNRITIITLCLTAWSAMTMVCGLAQNFVQLLAYRVGVGVGEAGCNPCSHSMIADAFAPAQRSRALSVYQLGATIGTMAGAMSAGVITQHFGWRAAFVAVGAPGLVLALIIKLAAKDPPRVQGEHPGAALAAGSLRAAVLRIVKSPALVNIVLGFTLASFASGSISGFTQPYFIRAFGLSYAKIGFVFGLSGGAASILCMLISGRVTDWAVSRRPEWHAGLPLLGVLLSIPCLGLVYTVGDWRVALAWNVAAGFLMYWFILPSLSAMHRLMGVRFVAAGMALILMFQNLLGLGTGPYVTGLVIDAATHQLFNLGDFAQLCPGGAARPGAAVAVAQACRSALTGATRIGLLCTMGVNLWACVHYAAAIFYVRRELARAL